MSRKSIYLVMLAALVLVAIPSVTHAQVENLVLNFSFEEDEVILNDPDWEQWCTWNPDDVTGSIVEIDDTEFIDGKRSLRIEPVGTENWHLVVAYISFPVTNGANVTASFWVKAAEPRPLSAGFKAADNTVTWGETDFDLTTEWAEYYMTSASQSDDVK
ncbi:MAG: carbohydrate binding domain-containing protein, partial [Planctomycetota bacterium]